MPPFTDKTVIVTGAGSGIGQATTLAFAREGATVVLCGRTLARLEATAAQIESEGGKALCIATDIRDTGSVEACVQQVTDTFGRVDVLVNNAGITRDKLLIRMTDDDWDTVLETNLKGAFRFSRAVAKPMMKQRAGAIVQISSIIGLMGNAGQCNYAASKGGLHALTKSLAKELAGRGIRVNAIAPGFIVSQMTDALPAQIKEQMLSAIPLGRFGRPEDVAAAALFLASEDASYMTGQILSVNGGMFM